MPPGARILDLGAGTGKLTRLLVPRGFRVLAVDPLADMLATLRAHVAGSVSVCGTAEAIPLASGSVDAVVCAQAIHWFRLPEALDEIARVLDPGGRLGLVWNRRDTSVGWVARLWGGLVDPLRGTVPGHETVPWRDAIEGHPSFAPLAERVFAIAQPCDADSLIERLDSTSFVNVLPPDEKAALFDRVRGFCASDPDLAGRDRFEIPYRTFVYATRRVD